MTYLLFLKMADERDVEVPKNYGWASLKDLSGTQLTDHYSEVLRKLRDAGGLLGDIFTQATSRFNNPVNLRRLIDMIDEEQWSAMEVDVKGAAFEGLLEKAASEGKKGAGQYFTPRPLIQTICRVMKADPRGKHDILITITGANVTKAGLVEQPLADAYVSQHVALVRLADVRFSKFLFYSLVSIKHGRKQLQAAAYGQGKPGLNLGNIRDVVVELPPVEEQQEIVRRVEALFAIADQIEIRYANARSGVSRLTKSILAKAFRGELVPEEANLAKFAGREFESSEQLLARIRHDRGISSTPKKSAKPTNRKLAAIG